MRNGDVKMLLVAYVSGFIDRRLLHDGNSDACRTFLISEAPSPSPTDVYIGFKGCNSTVQSLNYQTEKLAETVG
jgi:hypothetical protein